VAKLELFDQGSCNLGTQNGFTTRNAVTTTLPGGRRAPRGAPIPPAEGERRAVGGYAAQYLVAGVRILDAINSGLESIRVADPEAGRVDDLQVLTPGRLDAYQIKWSRSPVSTSWGRLLEADGTSPGLLNQLADGWRRLRAHDPDRRVVVHLITNDRPSVTEAARGSLERFAHEVWPQRHAGRPDLASGWQPAWDDCAAATGLSSGDFDQFVTDCELEFGFAVERSPFATGDRGIPVGATDIATLLWQTVASPARIVEVDRDSLLDRLGWAHLYRQRHRHEFPVDARIYRAPRGSRAELDRMLARGIDGYAAVVGPPGSGKSSLLTDALRVRPERVVRYYAFVPGDSAGPLRGEAISLLNDLVVALRDQGFRSSRLPRDDRQGLHEELREQLAQLGREFDASGRRTILLIDGLDHTVRQPAPDRPFIAELPEPDSIPRGVLVLLGSQTTELDAMPASIRVQVAENGRRVELGALESARVDEVIDAWEFDPPLDDGQRDRVRRLAAGHPLSLIYALRYLVGVSSVEERDRRLEAFPAYDGYLAGHYQAYWTALSGERDVQDALALFARIRGPIDVSSLVAHLGAPGLGTRIEERAGHYFLRPAAHRWSFFHDSFRQFLVDRTAPDDVPAHRRLASWTETQPGSAELLYHRIKAGDNEAALTLATFEYFREQYLRRRPPEAILRDIRLLAGVATRLRRIGDLVRLLLIDSEIEQRGYIIEREPLVRVLARLGEVDNVVEFAKQPARIGSQDRVDREAALALARVGAEEAAREIFDVEGIELAVPADDVVGRMRSGLRRWSRTAALLLPVERLVELVAELSNGERTAAANPAAAFVSSAGNELLDRAEIGAALTLARRLRVEVDTERDVRAHLLVRAVRTYRYRGDPTRAIETLDETLPVMASGDLPVDIAYALALELVAAGHPEAATVTAALRPPGEVQFRTSTEGLAPYRSWIAWISVRFALGETPSYEDEVERLGGVDPRIGRVGYCLGRMAGTAVAGGLNVWIFRELAEAIIRAFLPRPDRPSHESYSLFGIRREAHEALVALAGRHGPEHLDNLFEVFELEWRRPVLVWPEELHRAILLAFVSAGEYEGRVRPWLERLEEREPGDDANSRFMIWIERADLRLALGDTQIAADFVDRALRTSFGVGYRKDYQLEWWLPWLDRVNRREPEEAGERIAGIAASIPDLDETTEGRATELAATELIGVAHRVGPALGGQLFQWLLDVGAVTFVGGAAALLSEALEAGADVRSVATFARAWVVPYEREAHVSLARAVAAGLAGTHATNAADFLVDGLAHYGRRMTRRAWAEALLEYVVPAGVVPASAVEPLILAAPPDPEETRAPIGGETPDPQTLEELAASLAVERFPSSSDVRRRMSLFVEDATNDQLASLRETLTEGPSTALNIAAEALLDRGDRHRARALAEAALERRSPRGWDRTWDNGSVLDTLALLRRTGPARAREAAHEALAADITSGSVDGSALLRSLAEILPQLTDDNVDREVWAALEPYLEGLLDLPSHRPAPALDGLAPRSSDQVLAALAAQLLDHPVALLAQLTRESLAAEIADGRAAAIAAASELVTGESSQAAAALTVLEIVAEVGARRIDPFRDDLQGLRNSSSLDVRLAALRVLGVGSDGLTAAPPPSNTPAAYIIAVPPSAATRLIRPRVLPEHGHPVAPTNEASVIVGGFDAEVATLARLSGRSRATIALRTVEVVREMGFGGALEDDYETALMGRLDAVGLKQPYVRPRAFAVRLAIGRVAGELLDHGFLAPDDAAALGEDFRWTDPLLDLVPLHRRPAWMAEPIRPRDSRTPVDQWVADAHADERQLPHVDGGVVVAEHSEICRLEWERPTETRRRSVVPAAAAGAVAAGREDLFVDTMVSFKTYPASGDPDGPLVMSNYGGVRFMTTKERWIALNPAVADSLNWTFDPEGIASWRGSDGVTRVTTAIWIEGYLYAPSPDFDEEPGFGSYLIATPQAIGELTELAGDLLAVETVERTAQVERRNLSATASQFWNWHRFD
jgi:hypothetical protein